MCADSHDGANMPFQCCAGARAYWVTDPLHLHLKRNMPLECNHLHVHLSLPSLFSILRVIKDAMCSSFAPWANRLLTALQKSDKRWGKREN